MKGVNNTDDNVIELMYKRKSVSEDQAISQAKKELSFLSRSNTNNCCVGIKKVIRDKHKKATARVLGLRLFIRGRAFDINKKIVDEIKERHLIKVPKYLGNNTYINVCLYSKVDGSGSSYFSSLEVCKVNGKIIRATEARTVAMGVYILKVYWGIAGVSLKEFYALNKLENEKLESRKSTIQLSRIQESRKSTIQLSTIQLSNGCTNPCSYIQGMIESITQYLPMLSNLKFLEDIKTNQEEIIRLLGGITAKGVDVKTVKSPSIVSKHIPEAAFTANTNEVIVITDKDKTFNSKINRLDDKFIKRLIRGIDDKLGAGYSRNKAYKLVCESMHIEGSDFNLLMKEFVLANPRLNGDFKEHNAKSYYKKFKLNVNGDVVDIDYD